MHSTTIAASALAFAASAMAQVAGFAVMSSPAKDEDVPAGSIYNIVWAANNHNGLVDVTLMAGATPETLQLGNKIATGVDVTKNQLSWTVDCSLGKDATYGIKIASQEDEDLFQYSFPFHIDNTNCGNQQFGKPGGESGAGGEEGGKEGVTTTSKATTTTTSKATTTSTSKATTTATTTATTKGGYGPPGGGHGPGGPYGGPKGPGYWSSDCETTTSAPPPPPPAPTTSLITSVVPPPAAPPAPPAPSTPAPVAAPPPAATTPAVEAPPSVVPVSPASKNGVTSLAVIAGIAVAAFAL